MKKNPKQLDVVFILDKSGSMSGSEEHTISSFNEYLEEEKKNSFDTRITTILFSSHYQYLYQRRHVSRVEALTEEDYFVGGCTALYDTIGNSILKMDKEDTDKVLYIIITDGYENASKQFTKDAIRSMIEEHSSWEFIYIGADIDSYATGGEIGIQKDNIANYKKDKKGISLLFQSLFSVEENMMEDEEISATWKQRLDDYIEENKD